MEQSQSLAVIFQRGRRDERFVKNWKWICLHTFRRIKLGKVDGWIGVETGFCQAEIYRQLYDTTNFWLHFPTKALTLRFRFLSWAQFSRSNELLSQAPARRNILTFGQSHFYASLSYVGSDFISWRVLCGPKFSMFMYCRNRWGRKPSRKTSLMVTISDWKYEKAVLREIICCTLCRIKCALSVVSGGDTLFLSCPTKHKNMEQHTLARW